MALTHLKRMNIFEAIEIYNWFKQLLNEFEENGHLVIYFLVVVCFNQPIWKILFLSNWANLPQISGCKAKKKWVATTYSSDKSALLRVDIPKCYEPS